MPKWTWVSVVADRTEMGLDPECVIGGGSSLRAALEDLGCRLMARGLLTVEEQEGSSTLTVS